MLKNKINQLKEDTNYNSLEPFNEVLQTDHLAPDSDTEIITF